MNHSISFNALLALVIMISLALGCSRFGGDKESTMKDLTRPAIDPNEPIPALSSDAVDALIIDKPELAKYRDEILTAERDAIKGALDDLRSKAKAANSKSAAVTLASPGVRIPVSENLARSADMDAEVAAGENDNWVAGLFDSPWVTVAMAAREEVAGIREFLIGHHITFFIPDQDKSNTGAGSKPISLKDEKTGKVEATATFSVDTAGGPPTLELETAFSMPVFGLEAGSKVSVKGNPCPDSDGKVDLHVKLVTNARSGKAGSLFYDKGVEAWIRATVGDDANLIGADFDMRQATHATTGGQQVDFITSMSTRVTGESYNNLEESDAKIVKGSELVSPADQQASNVGLKDAFYLAEGALEAAKDRWKKGGCVQIEATSPGTVATNSTTSIPVQVRHKQDGSEVPSKLEAKLTGEKSLDPLLIPKTAGTLTYVAPSEKNKSATIALTATSRRGIATLDLTATTGGQSYRVSGTSNGVSFSGVICSLDKAFNIDAKFPGGTATTTFAPDGMTTVSGGGGGCQHSGGGSYTVTKKDDGSATLDWTTSDKIACPGFSNSRTATFTLPLQPASDLSCP